MTVNKNPIKEIVSSFDKPGLRDDQCIAETLDILAMLGDVIDECDREISVERKAALDDKKERGKP